MAGGQPISESVADAAAEWLTLLMSGEATDNERRRWQQWRTAHPDHERAWKHIEAVTSGLKTTGATATYQTLSPYAGPKAPGRRKALGLLVWGGLIGVTGVLVASRTQVWRQRVADYDTGTGEQRTVALSDGTRILLNTASAIDVRFDAQRRLVRLVAGEIMIVTGHAQFEGAPDDRPFIVQTQEGRVRALGTRFTVRQDEASTDVAVLESAVEITPAERAVELLVLHAGERIRFTRDGTGPRSALDEQDVAWTRGQIVADNVRLGDFLVNLARYRPGIVQCEAEVADLRVSGVFPLDDTDRILDTLTRVLPVQVRSHTRYWITVATRP